MTWSASEYVKPESYEFLEKTQKARMDLLEKELEQSVKQPIKHVDEWVILWSGFNYLFKMHDFREDYYNRPEFNMINKEMMQFDLKN